MAVSSLTLSFASTALTNRLYVRDSTSIALSSRRIIACSSNTCSDEAEGKCKRRTIAIGIGALSLNLFPARPLLAEGIPENYVAFVDKIDGYSYYYPSDWREFDFRGHDSAFKDRYLQLQNVRLSFIPTDKTDIHDLGPMEEVVLNLVRNVFSAPTQVDNIVDMQERTIDGRTYCTFEYILTSPNFSRAAFATIAIGNGRYYTLIVGANERRWRRVRNKLKVVADSFKFTKWEGLHSIHHPPGDDPNGYELGIERWSPVHTVESIVLSIISMLSSPNDESPANVEAAKEWREQRDEFKKNVSRVRRSQEML